MAMTAAERAKRYRDGKRDDSNGDTVTKRDETVTEPKRDAVTGIDKALADNRVKQAEFEKVVDEMGPLDFGLPSCQCRMCANVRAKGKDPMARLNHGSWMSANDLPDGMINRVPLPGDADYVGVCQEVTA